MKKALLASLITYFSLLFAIVAMMITYFVIKRSGSALDISGLFKAVSWVFAAFVLTFAVVIVFLIIYPKKLRKEYYEKVTPIVQEHLQKFGQTPCRVVVTSKVKDVYVSFMMANENDTYHFCLKESPLTRTEASRLSMNFITEIYGKQL